MKDAIKEALALLRSQGIRIPRSFTNRLNKKSVFIPNRADLRSFKENCASLAGGGRMVVGLTAKGVLTFHTYDAYQNLHRNAANARKHLVKKDVIQN